MKISRLFLILLAGAFLLLLHHSAQAQTVYYGSRITYDSSAGRVTGESLTEADYQVAWYYDPYVEGYLYDSTSSGSLLDARSNDNVTQNLDGSLDAYARTSANAYRSKSYTVISDHYVIAYYEDYGCFYAGCGYYYDDVLGFSDVGHGSYGGYNYFYGNGSYGYVTAEYIYLVSSYADVQTGDPTPQITGIDPPNWAQNDSVNVPITGSGFGNNPSVQVDGYGVTATVLSASDTQIVASFSVASDATLGNHNVTVTSRGYSGNGFVAGPGGGSPNSNSASFNVENPSGDSRATFMVSTGDPASAHPVRVRLFTSPNIYVRVDFAAQLVSNIGGSSQSTITIPEVIGRSPSVNTTIKAGPDGSSGVFNAILYANNKQQPSTPPLVIVPPQILLQMMINEARSLRDNPLAERYLGWSIRNRFGDSNFPQTYQTNIINQASHDATVTTGVEPEMYNASSVFAAPDSNSDPTKGCFGFWSPSDSQFAEVSTMLDTQTTTMSDRSLTGLPFYYTNDPSITQIVYFPEIGANTLPGKQNAPAFLFFRRRTPDQPAAVQYIYGPLTSNPIDTPPFFVSQQYTDFYARGADQGGWDYWSVPLIECGSDTTCLRNQQVGVSRAFMDSAEFRQNHPALLNSPGTPEYNQEFIRQCYLVYFRREPDSGGYGFWVNNLNTYGDESGVVSAFITSAEYRQRFGQP